MKYSPMSVAAASVLGALILQGGCSPGERSSGEPVIRTDSGAVRIVESTRPEWGEASPWSIDSVPAVDLAASGAGPNHEFYRVRDATRLPDGRIVVANYGTAEVRFYDGGGTFLRSSGGEGQGPGEFQRLVAIKRYRGDSLAAFDYWARRITVLDADGDLSRVVSLQEQDGLAGSMDDQLLPLPGGRFLIRISNPTVLDSAQGRIRVPRPVLALAADGTLQDTLVVTPGSETWVFPSGSATPPLSKTSHVAIRGDQLVVGPSDHLAFEVYDLQGRLEQIVRVPEYPLEVPEEAREAIRQTLLQMEAPDFIRALNRDMAEAVPERGPAYGDLVVDPEGFVWASEYEPSRLPEPVGSWLVFAPDGQWLGRVTGPEGFELYEVGADYLLGRQVDSLGVETIQLLRLDRSLTRP